ncbi:winged helix-turn-helix domain-containing protein [Streptomyces purpureus]|uniref:helix-turn-helix domain-containing protein n=1 Tax=Streptomyces purpureus TaxID=1951 RepID=UPI003570D0B2
MNRVKVIGRRCHMTYTIQGVRKLLVRSGWSCQVPARRAIERDDEAVAGPANQTETSRPRSSRSVARGLSISGGWVTSRANCLTPSRAWPCWTVELRRGRRWPTRRSCVTSLAGRSSKVSRTTSAPASFRT